MCAKLILYKWTSVTVYAVSLVSMLVVCHVDRWHELVTLRCASNMKVHDAYDNWFLSMRRIRWCVALMFKVIDTSYTRMWLCGSVDSTDWYRDPTSSQVMAGSCVNKGYRPTGTVALSWVMVAIFAVDRRIAFAGGCNVRTFRCSQIIFCMDMRLMFSQVCVQNHLVRHMNVTNVLSP